MNLYLDISGGISGDMFMAALLGLGADFEEFRRKMKTLPIGEEFDLRLHKMKKGSIEGLKVDVEVKGCSRKEGHHHSHDHHNHSHPEEEAGHEPARGEEEIKHSRSREESGQGHHHHGGEGEHHHRRLKDILKIIEQAEISSRASWLASETFRHLASAEARVHGMEEEEVHFHEVGAVDSIVDIIGVCLLIDQLSVQKVYYNELPMGRGQVQTEHGLMPLPAPATLILMEGMRARISPERGEMVTPTGVALLKALGAEEIPADRPMKLLGTSISCGQQEFGIPNILRGALFHFEEEKIPTKPETLFMLECNIDDMTGEFLAATLERLLRGGALDAWIQPIVMKKGRPGHLLKALTMPMNYEEIRDIFLSATTTLGVRMYEVSRTFLHRDQITKSTDFGDVSIKSVIRPDGSKYEKIEFEDIKRLAEENKVSELRMQRELKTALERERDK